MNKVRDLLQKSPPLQFLILEDLVDTFSISPAVHSAHVRGSIARNDYDRASDVDLILVVEDTAFPELVSSLDDVLRYKFSTLLPGWHDSIVPNFGGVGYVYLLQSQNQIIQADIYLLPKSAEAGLNSVPRLQTVFEREELGDTSSEDLAHRSQIFIQDLKKKRPTLTDQLIEIFILGNLIKKRLTRGQRHLNYAETQAIHICLRNMLRSIFDPLFVDYGWYHFDENLRQSQLSRSWLDRFDGLLFGAPILNTESLNEVLTFAVDLVWKNRPEAMRSMTDSITFLTRQFNPSGHTYDLNSQGIFNRPQKELPYA